MTQKELFQAVIDGNITDEAIAKAQACLDSIDASNAKRSAKNAENKKANIEFTAKVVEALGTEPMTASDLAEMFDVKPQKVSTCLRLYGEGYEKVDIKIDGKARKAYVKA